jgi:hypothetical protein
VRNTVCNSVRLGTDGHWIRAIFGESEPPANDGNRKKFEEAATTGRTKQSEFGCSLVACGRSENIMDPKNRTKI